MELIKHRIAHYWAHRAEAFQTQRIREFEDEKHARWLAEFNRYIPHDRTLRVLDLGTGTGFFAFVFAAEGHDATGIDLTPDMIEKAKETVGILGVDAQFEVMDAEQPAFPPESFDVLVTRNLTWTLPHLPMAYREWYKLLKPGGAGQPRAQEHRPRPLGRERGHQSRTLCLPDAASAVGCAAAGGGRLRARHGGHGRIQTHLCRDRRVLQPGSDLHHRSVQRIRDNGSYVKKQLPFEP